MQTTGMRDYTNVRGNVTVMLSTGDNQRSALYNLQLIDACMPLTSGQPLINHLRNDLNFFRKESDLEAFCVINTADTIIVTNLDDASPSIYVINRKHPDTYRGGYTVSNWTGKLVPIDLGDVESVRDALHQSKEERALDTSSHRLDRAITLVTGLVNKNLLNKESLGINADTLQSMSGWWVFGAPMLQQRSFSGPYQGFGPQSAPGIFGGAPGYQSPYFGGQLGTQYPVSSQEALQQSNQQIKQVRRSIQNESRLSQFAVDGHDAVLSGLLETFSLVAGPNLTWQDSAYPAAESQAVNNFYKLVASQQIPHDRTHAVRSAAMLLAALITSIKARGQEVPESIELLFDELVGVK